MTSTVEEAEGQNLEFKTSLAEEAAGIQALVGFANSRGGRVLFGVRDDRTVAGVDVGANTLENLACAIRDHTYPSLPVFIDEKAYGERNVVVAEVGADIPPVVGIYLYSSGRLRSDAETSSSQMQAFRRVGRVTQREDFMRVRAPLATDPLVRLTLTVMEYLGNQHEVSGVVWVEDGSGTAHNLNFYCDSPEWECGTRHDDLPYPEERREMPSSLASSSVSGVKLVRSIQRQAKFRFTSQAFTTPAVLTFSVTYNDDWGLSWRASRRIEVGTGSQDEPNPLSAQFERRIVAFPPKTRLQP